MAKTTITTTDTMVEVATGAAVITILKKGSGTLLINESATDVNASPFGGDIEVNDQIQQNAAVSSFVRHNGDGAGWKLLIDGTL